MVVKKKMNVSEKIIKFLEKKGVKHCMLITGGHVMYLNDALFRSKIKPVFFHHEQAAGMAAEAYGRIMGLGVVMITAGPGVLNVLNGVVGGFVDSSPMLVISGANYSAEVTYLKKYNMRQIGLQGINTEAIVTPIVKKYYQVKDGSEIKEAYELATSDRKGPCWLEVSLDVQSKRI